MHTLVEAARSAPRGEARAHARRWLEGQKAVVTGASSGIGRTVAITPGEAGV